MDYSWSGRSHHIDAHNTPPLHTLDDLSRRGHVIVDCIGPKDIHDLKYFDFDDRNNFRLHNTVLDVFALVDPPRKRNLLKIKIQIN